MDSPMPFSMHHRFFRCLLGFVGPHVQLLLSPHGSHASVARLCSFLQIEPPPRPAPVLHATARTPPLHRSPSHRTRATAAASTLLRRRHHSTSRPCSTQDPVAPSPTPSAASHPLCRRSPPPAALLRLPFPTLRACTSTSSVLHAPQPGLCSIF